MALTTMPARLRVLFWNVSNLFEPGACPRGPRSLAEYNAKLNAVARGIHDAAATAPLDVIALAEISTERTIKSLIARLGSGYDYAWAGARDPGVMTGLAVLGRSATLDGPYRPQAYSPVAQARPRYLLTEWRLKGRNTPILVVVNHWKSRLKQTNVDDAQDRFDTARELGDALARETQAEAALVMGDFNAEPFEKPFSDSALRAKRFFSNALWPQATMAHLYNPMWRFLPEPHLWENSDKRPHPFPSSSCGESTRVVFDHIMVSGGALLGRPLQLLEGTVAIYHDPQIALTKRTGRIVPRRWKYNVQHNTSRGCSDHLPVTATLSIGGPT